MQFQFNSYMQKETFLEKAKEANLDCKRLSFRSIEMSKDDYNAVCENHPFVEHAIWHSRDLRRSKMLDVNNPATWEDCDQDGAMRMAERECGWLARIKAVVLYGKNRFGVAAGLGYSKEFIEKHFDNYSKDYRNQGIQESAKSLRELLDDMPEHYETIVEVIHKMVSLQCRSERLLGELKDARIIE